MLDEYGHSNLKDWCDFCEGKMNHDKKTKLNIRLLFPLKSDQEYLQFFSYFSQSNELFSRFKNLPPNSKPDLIKTDLMQLVRKEITNMQIVCEIESNSKLSELMSEGDIIIENLTDKQYQDMYSSDIHREFEDCISEYTYKNRLEQKPGYSDVFDLFLYLCGNNYRMAYSLSSPLLENGKLFEHYLDIRAKGFDYCITTENIVVTKITK